MSNFRRRLMSILKGKLLQIFGKPPLLLEKSSGKNIYDYTLNGNCTQDGTPTPESPVIVNEVGDITNNILTNLLAPGQTGTIAGVNYIVNKDLSINLKGTTTGTFSLRIAGKWANTESVVKLSSGNYTISGKSGNFYLSTYLSTASGVSPTAFYNTRANNPMNFSVSSETNIGDIFVYCSIIGSEIDDTIYPSLVAGTYTNIPEYEPYNKYKIPVQITRHNICTNIFSNTALNYSTGIETVNNNYRSADFMEIDPTLEYTIYRDQAAVALGLRFYDKDKNYLGSAAMGVDVNLYKFTANKMYGKANSKYIRWSIASTAYIKYILTQGDIIGNYSDYLDGYNNKIFLDNPIRKIESSSEIYVDTINFKEQKVYRNCNKSIWKNSDTISVNLVNNSIYRYSLKISNLLETTRYFVYCNRGSFGTADNIGTSFAFLNLLYYYPPTSITDLESFKDWITNNELYMIYPLSAQTEEEIIYCPTLKTYDGDCDFKILTDLLPSEVKLYYYGGD